MQLSQKKMICFACEPAAGQLRNDNFWKKWKFLVMRNSYNFCGRTVHFWYMKNCKFLIQMTSVFYICTTLKKGFFNSRTFLLLPYNKKIPPHKSSTAYTWLQSLLPVLNLYHFSSIFIYFLLSSYPLIFFSTNSRNHYNCYPRNFSFYFIEFLEIFSL